jgi:hypothetical protein
MRDAARRSEKYSKKITGMVIPGQASRYAPTAAERTRLEAIVRSLGAAPMLAFSYLAFAEQLWKIKKTHSGQTALDEGKVIANSWSLRGLDDTYLWRIGKALGMGDVVTLVPSLHERYIIHDDIQFSMWTTRWCAQTFTVGSVGANENHTITSVKLKMYKLGTLGTVTVSIRGVDGTGKPTGGDLSTGTMNGDTLPIGPPGAWQEITMTPYVLQSNTQYAIVIRLAGGDLSNILYERRDETGAAYGGGIAYYSSTGGTTWDTFPDSDCMFEVWGTPI